jgi:hypothetical protein
MRRAIERRPARGDVVEPIEVLAYTPDLHDEFLDTLMSTYNGTLDCPELNGVRSADEVFEGFTPDAGQTAGPWFLVKESARPIGVVMLDRVAGAASCFNSRSTGWHAPEFSNSA